MFVMKINFSSNKLQKTFNSEKELKRQYGSEQAKKIKTRIGVLKAAANLAEVPVQKPERCHQLEGNRKNEFAVDLKHPFRLIFRPEILSKDGVYDLTEITSIIITAVEDYHGN